MSDPIPTNHTHRVNIGCGYPVDPYASPRFVMSETFDSAMTRTVPEVPASEDGKTPAVPEKQVRIFTPEKIAEAVEKGHLIPLAAQKKATPAPAAEPSTPPSPGESKP